ncbi:MAG: hypothetical protein KAJ58_01950 [Candidatus Pacebacteria bacterium]|nr:hypothetical protein [Candidatus Paceibacterota bacterium]
MNEDKIEAEKLTDDTGGQPRSENDTEAEKVVEIYKKTLLDSIYSQKGLNNTLKLYKKETDTKLSQIKEETKEKIDNSVNDLKEEIAEQIDKIQETKDQNIETLGIFVSLFTFISFSVQIFKSESSPFFVLGIISFILGALVLFIFILNATIKKEGLFHSWYIYVVPIILFFSGFVMTYIGYNDSLNQKNRQLDEKYYNKKEVDLNIDNIKDISEQNLTSFKNCIKTKGLSECVGYEK